jgi:drug/metabolite transporter (DMT)-like permease
VGSTELAMVLLSALLHAAWSAAIKGSASPLGFNLLQNAFGVVAALVLLPFFVPAEVPRAVWGLLAATGLAHALYVYFMSRAYERAELSLVYPIIRSTPALLPFLAVPWLGESISAVGAFGIAVVVAGVWLVHLDRAVGARALVAPGVGFAYLTLATTVAYSLIDKRSMDLLEEAAWTGPAPRSVVYFFLLSSAHAVFFVPLALRRVAWRGVADTARAEGRRAALALLASFASYGLILEAFRTAQASYVVAVRQSSVLFAVALAILLLKERPGRSRVAGATLTVGGVALIALVR